MTYKEVTRRNKKTVVSDRKEKKKRQKEKIKTSSCKIFFIDLITSLLPSYMEESSKNFYYMCMCEGKN